VHVHIGWHFGERRALPAARHSPADAALYGAENMYTTLMNGFTTVQSLGAPSDKPLREAVTRGVLPGPRLLTSMGQINDAKMTPDQIRDEIKRLKGEGADVIKIFASLSIRDGGAPTMSQDQMNAACGEAKAQGLRTIVHAHSSESIKRTVHGGCNQVEHGSLADAEALKLMADTGVIFDPNIGLVIQNYLENKAHFMGIGNYNEDVHGKGDSAEPHDVRPGVEDARIEDGDGHRRRRRRTRTECARDDRAHSAGTEADAGHHGNDVARGAVNGSRQGDGRTRPRPVGGSRGR
jgi:imidazolonepropionase-like amidohydrolase